MEDDLNNVQSIFGKVSKVESSYEVHATAKHYPKFIKVFEPLSPYSKMVPFMEEHIDGEPDDVDVWQNNVTNNIKTSNEDNLERSLRKTKTLISDYVLCNDFDLFATFTFSQNKTADRFNPNIVKLQMANWLKNQRKRNGRFEYIIVPEFHKDRKALHFHALFNNYPGELIDSGRNHKGRQIFHFKSYTLGFNSAVKIDSPEKVSSYIRKYITKDMPQFHDKHRFWATTGLKRPRIEDNPTWYLHEVPLNTIPTEYGRIMFFPVNSSTPAPNSDFRTKDSTKPSHPEKEA